MSTARYFARLLDWSSHTLPRALTGAPTIAGEPLDPFLHWLLRLRKIRGAKELSEQSPQDVRAALRKELLPLRKRYALPEVIDFTVPVPGLGGELSCRRYVPPRETECGALMVYFHGGGFVYCDLDTHDDHCRLMARESGMQIISVDYRLAPEHPFPAGYDDAEAVTRWVVANAYLFNIEADRIVIGGDSAGATLATAVAVAMAQGKVHLAGQLLFYPGTDFVTDRPSREQFSDNLFLSKEDRAWSYGYYLQGADPADWRISPLKSPGFEGVAPALIVTSALDILRDEGHAYANALSSNGALLDHITAQGLGHGFVNLVGIHQRSEAMVTLAARKMRAHLERLNVTAMILRLA